MDSKIILVQDEPRGPSQLIEVIVNQNGLGRLVFPDVPQLRSTIEQTIVIKKIRLITPEVLVRGPISGQVGAPAAELQKMSLVIYCEGWEKAQYIPVLVLNDMTVPNTAFPHRYDSTRFDNWINVDWSKTYVQFSNGVVSANAPYCVMFDVEYVKINKDGKTIIGPS